MSATITETDRVQVQIASGFSTIVINLDTVDDGFEVSAARFYRTYQGARVAGTVTRKFADRDSARAYANGYFARFTARGWKRVA